MPESTPPTTLINGGWIVAFDGERHRILRDGVVVYQGATITHVGKTCEGPVDHRIDARAHLVSPGFVNAHVHVGAHTGDRFADYWPDNEPVEAVFPRAFESWEE